MPPVGNTPQDNVRYLTKILAAFVQQAGGELRIGQKFLRTVAEESSRQALFEDTDTKKDELVLRFGSKHSAIYPIEPECRVPEQPASRVQSQPQTPANLPSQPANPGRAPMTESDLARIETKIRQMRAAAAIRAQQQRSQTGEPLPDGVQ